MMMNSFKEIVDLFISTQVLENLYWMYNGLLTREEVIEFLEKRADSELLNKVGYYILAHVENTALGVYLLNRDERYIEFMRPTILKLRELYKELLNTEDIEEKYKIINKMLSECFKVGVDPF